ncbi:CRISPR-associated helicase Cas3' [Desulfovibrio sp. ZJ369]|uniref:CRISPR-associated helicase Cas3' n=1 Tax=Desulfovibrio sp. ZJ369 TaxID=2709793 RepID=UPI0013ED3F2B|nr:CRISPR-associated helicase Cas3' [Desulfovibrio sp. ZJ369]
MEELRFWAKTAADGQPGICVAEHLRNVALVAAVLAQRYACVLARLGLTADQAAFLAACHDVGKISRDFQSKCRPWLAEQGWLELAAAGDWARRTRAHGELTNESLARFLTERAVCGDQGASSWAAAIGSHHGRTVRPTEPGLPPPPEKSDPATQVDWEAARRCALEEAWQAWQCPRLPDADPAWPGLWFLAGLVSLADWLGSDERFFPPDCSLPQAEAACRARQAVGGLGLGPLSVRRGLSFEDLFDCPPYAVQRLAGEVITGPGVYVLEAPMGQGKTEAALYAAYRLLEQGRSTGIYFALPTQATSNRMHERLEQFCRRACPQEATLRHNPQLIHASSWLREDCAQPTGGEVDRDGEPGGEPDANRRWFASSKRALLAPLGVGTVDQALLSVVAARHFFVRRFALAGKVVILDEVHSYDVYTGTLIENLCQELIPLGCTLIILSATLTPQARARLLGAAPPDEAASEPYPLLTARPDGAAAPDAHPAPPPKDKTVRIAFASRAELLRRAREAAAQGAAVLWVCDTVESAQQTRQELAADAPAFPVGLLHSRFPYFKRQELEKHWLDRLGRSGSGPRGGILVSTQIVEQSVDIDADLLITELAPSDMLLQRLGRLQRHERGPRRWPPRCLLVEEAASLNDLRGFDERSILAALGPKAHVYAPYALLRSLEVWSALDELSLPSDIRDILAHTWEDKALPSAWERLRDEADGRNFAAKQMAALQSNIWNLSQEDREGPLTRNSGYETRVVALCARRQGQTCTLLNGESVRLPEGKSRARFDLQAARALARNSLRLPAYCLDLAPAPFLQRNHVDALALLEEKGVLSLRGLKSEYRLLWDPDLGVRLFKND